jgi:hypothetical protein
MKFRIIEKEGIYIIQTYKSLKEFGLDGFWHNTISYMEPVNELNYYYSLQSAEKAVCKLIENIKNPIEPEKVIREYSL